MSVNVSGRPISPMLQRFLADAAELRERARVVDEQVEKAVLAEAGAEGNYRLAYAMAFEAADGTQKAREYRADIVCAELFRQWQQAIALRRSATEASKTLHHQLDAFGALANLSNREIKAEMSMGGFE